ncbi:hypothetical protein E1301_Tti011257 [Triplophysa tibetana]|uniref:Uncharacterized protein n=1 Tax=Triplophysa tibetana TaxID=1572043 RepID=A0A5A9N285_9TELE|nr:hypothetical protein E1301_Tti011257 [Triplophysa tibetana]
MQINAQTCGRIIYLALLQQVMHGQVLSQSASIQHRSPRCVHSVCSQLQPLRTVTVASPSALGAVDALRLWISQENKVSEVRHVDLVTALLNDIRVKSRRQYYRSRQHHY